MIQARHDRVHLLTPLEFEECTKALRNALRHSPLEVIAERPLDREIQQKLGMPLKRYMLFTVWDPMQIYQALLADEGASMYASLNVVVSEGDEGSMITAQTEVLPADGAGTLAMKLMAESVTEEVMHVLEQVDGQARSLRDDGWGSHIMRWLRGRSKQECRSKMGGSK